MVAEAQGSVFLPCVHNQETEKMNAGAVGFLLSPVYAVWDPSSWNGDIHTKDESLLLS